ncbi:MAG: T9SS type A sorting domain-containing protein, partial [Bacteroidales bacterium]|nr:T9SS type A sorting domain-containing protein [Bacteroidales bacterium]
ASLVDVDKRISTSPWDKGSYMIKFYSQNQTFVEKIIVQ